MLPAMALLWLEPSFGEACDISVWFIAPPLLASPMPEPDAVEGPWPAGGPPPGCERCAKAGELHTNIRATNGMRCVRFTDSSCSLFSGLTGKAVSPTRPCRGALLLGLGCTDCGEDSRRLG